METTTAFKIVYKRPGSVDPTTATTRTVICRSFNFDTYGVLHISGFMTKIKDINGNNTNQYIEDPNSAEFMYIGTEYTLEKIIINV